MSLSLWLVPHEDHPFTKTFQELISDYVPSKFESTKLPTFTPHVPVTSDIDPAQTYESSGKSAQEWLDSLQFSEVKSEDDHINLVLESLEPGEEYYKKLIVVISDKDNLMKLAAQCRQGVLSATQNGHSEGEAQKWVKKEYVPHMALMYGDVPKQEVEKKALSIELQLGFAFGSLFACCGETLCLGAKMVLVDTSKPIEEWTFIAKREIPQVNWKLSRTLA